MRFHIGFSKFIKPSKLLYWLGLAFIGLLAWLGLTQQEVFASQTFTNFNLCPYMTGNTTVSYSEYRGQNNITHNNNASYQSGYAYYCNRSPNNSSRYNIIDYYNGIVYAVGVNANSNIQVNEVSTININTNFCGNVADTNSLDLFFSFESNSFNTIVNKLNQSYFNNYYTIPTSVSDVVSFYIVPRYQNEQLPLAEYTCHLDYEDNDSVLYNLICEGVPFDSNVLSYDLKIYNNVYQTFENKNNVFYINTSMGVYDFQAVRFPVLLTHYVDYQCSYVEPVQPDEPLFPEDATGSSNITTSGSSGGHCFGEDCASSTVNQSDLFISWINDIDINEGLQDLLTLPKNIIDVVVSESGSSCNPISINFSSITQTFGGFNYSLQIPCMRTVLSNLLDYEIFNGVTIYNLFDLLMGFGLLIVFANRFHGAINNILSGDSLSEYTDL